MCLFMGCQMIMEQNYLKACWTIADPGGRAGTCSQVKKFSKIFVLVHENPLYSYYALQ
jgi:hypothetical protein